MCALRSSSSTPVSLLSLFASTSEENPAHLQSQSYDQLLEQAASGGDSGLSALQQAETFLNEQAVFYPLYYTSRYYTANPTLTGVVIHPAGQGIDFIQAGKEG